LSARSVVVGVATGLATVALAGGTAWAPAPAPGDIASGLEIGFPMIIFEGEVWLLKTDAQFEEIRAAGFNIMQTYDMATSDDDAVE
jgi:hypothetical protein